MHAENMSRARFGLAFLALIGAAGICIADYPEDVFSMPMIPVSDSPAGVATLSPQAPIPIYSSCPNSYCANQNIYRTSPRVNDVRPHCLNSNQNSYSGRPLKKIRQILHPPPKPPLQKLEWFHYIRGEGPAIWIHD